MSSRIRGVVVSATIAAMVALTGGQAFATVPTAKKKITCAKLLKPSKIKAIVGAAVQVVPSKR